MSLFGLPVDTDIAATQLAIQIFNGIYEVAKSWRTGREKEDPDQQEARVLYWEIVYNVIMLGAGQNASPPAYLAAHDVWDRSSVGAAASRALRAGQMGPVVAAYLQLNTVEWIFSQGWTKLAQTRVSGGDRKVLEQARQMFLRAEGILRDQLFAKDDAQALARAMEAVPTPIGTMQPLGERLHGVVLAIPPHVAWTLFGLAWVNVIYGNKVLKALERSSRAVASRW